MSRSATLDSIFANLSSAQLSLTNALSTYVGTPEPKAPKGEAKPKSPAKPESPKPDKATRLATRRAKLRAEYGPTWFEHPAVIADKAERKAKWEAIVAAKAAKDAPAPAPAKKPKASKKASANRAAAAAAVAKAAK